MINETTISINSVFETSEDAEKFEKNIPSVNPTQFIRPADFDTSSIFTAEDQNIISGIVVSYQDAIPHNNLFEKIKDYETEFKEPSSDFYTKWRAGSIPSDPKTSEWASIYRVIYGNN